MAASKIHNLCANNVIFGYSAAVFGQRGQIMAKSQPFSAAADDRLFIADSTAMVETPDLLAGQARLWKRHRSDGSFSLGKGALERIPIRCDRDPLQLIVLPHFLVDQVGHLIGKSSSA